ncbi:hypothetical protein BGZ79_003226, partial [Entomortierella chlamydospora]
MANFSKAGVAKWTVIVVGGALVAVSIINPALIPLITTRAAARCGLPIVKVGLDLMVRLLQGGSLVLSSYNIYEGLIPPGIKKATARFFDSILRFFTRSNNNIPPPPNNGDTPDNNTSQPDNNIPSPAPRQVSAYATSYLTVEQQRYMCRELSLSQERLSNTRAQLKRTQGELTRSENELRHTRKQLNESKQQLAESQKQLVVSQKQLDRSQRQLNESQLQLTQSQDQNNRLQELLEESKERERKLQEL